MRKNIDANLILLAVKMDINNRKPESGLIFHSDRGTQYASNKVENLFRKFKIRSSMSRKGDCWDNAVA